MLVQAGHWLHGTLLQGLYTTPAIHIDLTATFTNTTAVDAYRGAGRPEATYLLERIIDVAAAEMKMMRSGSQAAISKSLDT